MPLEDLPDLMKVCEIQLCLHTLPTDRKTVLVCGMCVLCVAQCCVVCAHHALCYHVVLHILCCMCAVLYLRYVLFVCCVLIVCCLLSAYCELHKYCVLYSCYIMLYVCCVGACVLYVLCG